MRDPTAFCAPVRIGLRRYPSGIGLPLSGGELAPRLLARVGRRPSVDCAGGELVAGPGAQLHPGSGVVVQRPEADAGARNPQSPRPCRCRRDRSRPRPAASADRCFAICRCRRSAPSGPGRPNPQLARPRRRRSGRLSPTPAKRCGRSSCQEPGCCRAHGDPRRQEDVRDELLLAVAVEVAGHHAEGGRRCEVLPGRSCCSAQRCPPRRRSAMKLGLAVAVEIANRQGFGRSQDQPASRHYG